MLLSGRVVNNSEKELRRVYSSRALPSHTLSNWHIRLQGKVWQAPGAQTLYLRGHLAGMLAGIRQRLSLILSGGYDRRLQ